MEKLRTMKLVKPNLKLSEEIDLKKIHEASIEILENIGMNFLGESALEIFKKNNIKIKGNRVFISAKNLEKSLKKVNSKVMIFDREGGEALQLWGKNDYFGTGSDTPFIIDAFTGERRKPFLKDIGLMAKMADALPNISFVMCMGIARDVPEKNSDIYHFREMVTNTTKPIIFTSWNIDTLKTIHNICADISGSKEAFKNKPFALLYAMPTAPLQHSKEVCDQIIYCAQNGIPLVYPSGPLLGATSPVTIAGSLAQLNAEFLSGFVLAQFVQPGATLVHGGATCPFDFKTMTMSIAAPEIALGYAVLKELTDFYNIPIFTLAGTTDSKVVDQQAALEASFSLAISCLSGQHLIHDVGYIEGGLTSSFEMLVLCNEIISMIRRFKKGFILDDESLALESINAAGPGGTFIDSESTLKFFKKEIWYPELLDRFNYSAWSEKGSKNMSQRVKEKVIDILNNHKAVALDNSIIKKINSYF